MKEKWKWRFCLYGMVLGIIVSIAGIIELVFWPSLKADVSDGLFNMVLGVLLMFAGMLNLFILLPDKAAEVFNLKEWGLR